MKYPRLLKRFCALLFAALLCVSAACSETAGSPTREERLAAAREKYNEKTVHVYKQGKGSYKSGKINAYVYQSKDKTHWIINIADSLKITDEYEMEAILEVIAQSKYYDEDYYGPISFMKAEWIAHNLAHEVASNGGGTQQWLEAYMGESLSTIIRRSKELDLSPLESMSEKELKIYRMIELLLNN